MNLRVELNGCDVLEVRDENGSEKRTASGCSEMRALVRELRAQHGDDPRRWPEPVGNGHHQILLREFIAKLNGTWQEPYKHEEICHCRMVALKTVDQAIVAGAHTIEKVRARTSANTACGTCREDIESVISNRLRRTS